MTKGSGSRRGASPRKAGAATGRSGRAAASTARRGTKKPPKPGAATPGPIVAPPGPFALGAIPGATPGKWIDAWQERMPQHPLTLVPLAVADQRRALLDGEVDVAIVRLPIDRDGLSVIAIYDELPVVVTSTESHLTAADELYLDDLGGEVVIVAQDDVLSVSVPGAVAPRFAAPERAEDAIATAASGVGAVIVPMSLARLHQRKDAASRPLRDGPVSTVAVAWVTDRTTPLVDAFVGIVRGRTANSSRG